MVKDRIGKLKIRKHGPPQKYNHAEIARQIKAGLSNRAIMSNVGCSKTLVWDIRQHIKRGRITPGNYRNM